MWRITFWLWRITFWLILFFLWTMLHICLREIFIGLTSNGYVGPTVLPVILTVLVQIICVLLLLLVVVPIVIREGRKTPLIIRVELGIVRNYFFSEKFSVQTYIFHVILLTLVSMLPFAFHPIFIGLLQDVNLGRAILTVLPTILTVLVEIIYFLILSLVFSVMESSRKLWNSSNNVPAGSLK